MADKVPTPAPISVPAPAPGNVDQRRKRRPEETVSIMSENNKTGNMKRQESGPSINSENQDGNEGTVRAPPTFIRA
jgi:hypothetical protein